CSCTCGRGASLLCICKQGARRRAPTCRARMAGLLTSGAAVSVWLSIASQ
ncbi:unnamed protein product, partial [Amoebophrya sp. A120]